MRYFVDRQQLPAGADRDKLAAAVYEEFTANLIALEQLTELGELAAAREARALMGIPGVACLNISGAASARGYEFAALLKAELATRIREQRDHDR